LNDIDIAELKNLKTRYYRSGGEMRFLKLGQPNLTWFVYSIFFYINKYFTKRILVSGLYIKFL
jgi:hypothetical protein